MATIVNIPTESARTIFLSAGAVLKIHCLPYYTHYGIYVGDGMVIHNSKQRGEVVLDTYEDFAKGRAVYPSDITSDNPEQAALKAWDCLGKIYDLFDFNCEHFVRYCHGLPITSNQKIKYLASGCGLAVSSQIRDPAVRTFANGFCVGVAFAPETEDPIKVGLGMGLGVAALYLLSEALTKR